MIQNSIINISNFVEKSVSFSEEKKRKYWPKHKWHTSISFFFQTLLFFLRRGRDSPHSYTYSSKPARFTLKNWNLELKMTDLCSLKIYTLIINHCLVPLPIFLAFCWECTFQCVPNSINIGNTNMTSKFRTYQLLFNIFWYHIILFKAHVLYQRHFLENVFCK